ncbi:MAG TPA: hypothetical protein VJC03_05925 [bacterium]|nr:hypothetical protein [bacterium]
MTGKKSRIKSVLKKVFVFYTKDCCWPYALSFYLVLLLYAEDFLLSERPMIWPSVLAYMILWGYYRYNRHMYRINKIDAVDIIFFIRYLALKIYAWGILLAGFVTVYLFSQWI